MLFDAIISTVSLWHCLQMSAEQSGRTQSIIQLGIVMGPKRIQIFSQCTTNEFGSLRDERDAFAQGIQVQFVRFNPIIDNFPFNSDSTKKSKCNA
jgi:hypothetical protein